MNATEYQNWSSDLFRKFPSIGAWFEKQDVDAALTDAWFEAISDCDVRDALVVNRRMLSGDDPGPDDAGWQNLPAHVRRLSNAARMRREELQYGLSQVPDLNGRRYRCGRCQDTGFVYVANRAAIECVLKGRPLEKCVHRQATARCSFCQMGRPRGIPAKDAKPGDDRKKIDPFPQFDQQIHYLLPMDECGGELKGAALEDFPQWVRETAAKFQGGNRLKVFDEYNRQPVGARDDDDEFPN